MGSVSVLILFMVIGAVICAKARVAGGAIAFSLIALVMFIATPVGSGLPDAIGTFVAAFDQAATPALGRTQQAGVTGSGS